MSKLFALSLATACAGLAFAAPVLSQDIIVTSPRSTETFVAQVTADLDNQLGKVVDSADYWAGDGYAIVQFECGDDGRPENIKVIRRDGSASVAPLARTAVARLASMHPLPAGIDKDGVFQANIAIAGSWHDLEYYGSKMARSEAQRMATAKTNRPVLAFTAGAAPQS